MLFLWYITPFVSLFEPLTLVIYWSTIARSLKIYNVKWILPLFYALKSSYYAFTNSIELSSLLQQIFPTLFSWIHTRVLFPPFIISIWIVEILLRIISSSSTRESNSLASFSLTNEFWLQFLPVGVPPLIQAFLFLSPHQSLFIFWASHIFFA